MLKIGDLVAAKYGIDQVVPPGERGVVRAVVSRTEILVWFCDEYKPYPDVWFSEQDLLLIESLEKCLARLESTPGCFSSSST